MVLLWVKNQVEVERFNIAQPLEPRKLVKAVERNLNQRITSRTSDGIRNQARQITHSTAGHEIDCHVESYPLKTLQRALTMTFSITVTPVLHSNASDNSESRDSRRERASGLGEEDENGFKVMPRRAKFDILEHRRVLVIKFWQIVRLAPLINSREYLEGGPTSAQGFWGMNILPRESYGLLVAEAYPTQAAPVASGIARELWLLQRWIATRQNLPVKWTRRTSTRDDHRVIPIISRGIRVLSVPTASVRYTHYDIVFF